jgi:wobble nucleotide-excising tRNase
MPQKMMRGAACERVGAQFLQERVHFLGLRQQQGLVVINKINKLENFGIFRDYSGAKTTEFGRYNLVYGWNGSGKSTVSSVFSSLEKRAVNPRFGNAKLSISVSDGTTITDQSIASNSVNIRTFNQDFVKENIDWDNHIKGILLVDKKKIDEREKLDALKVLQKSDEDDLVENSIAASRAQTERDKFLSGGAKRLKTNLQSIDTSDSYFLNYDKRKFEQFLISHAEALKGSTPVADDELLDLTKAAKPTMLDKVAVPTVVCEQQTFLSKQTALQALLDSNVVNTAIARLRDNQDIRDWVQAGLALHDKHQSGACEFCGTPLQPGTIQTLQGHFSKAYEILQKQLKDEQTALPTVAVSFGVWPDEGLLYDEFRAGYITARQVAEDAVEAVNAYVNDWVALLDTKIKNPIDVGATAQAIPAAIIDAARTAIDAATKILERHNSKTTNFDTELKASKLRLEESLVGRELADYKYFDSAGISEDLKKKADVLRHALTARKLEMQAIEESLSNEGLGAAAFNDNLHRFLGRSELSLVFNANAGGYEIIRNGVPKHDGNLSEGEKTALAFVYFITKLSEHDNEIGKTVVVVDDPVSSFDSNHLFHAYSFLRNRCDDAMQLFVLTHNFTYFKLVRDWLAGRNRNRKNAGKPEVGFFYTIDSVPGNPRSSVLADAGASLTDYNSEYHFIYQKLMTFRDLAELDREQSFFAANLARKLLEIFFSFKYPRHRSDIAALLLCGQKGCEKTTDEVREKVYRFINKYSHSVVIDINEDAADNMMGEGQHVVRDIFTWIEEVDPTHYTEMELAIKEQP